MKSRIIRLLGVDDVFVVCTAAASITSRSTPLRCAVRTFVGCPAVSAVWLLSFSAIRNNSAQAEAASAQFCCHMHREVCKRVFFSDSLALEDDGRRRQRVILFMFENHYRSAHERTNARRFVLEW